MRTTSISATAAKFPSGRQRQHHREDRQHHHLRPGHRHAKFDESHRTLWLRRAKDRRNQGGRPDYFPHDRAGQPSRRLDRRSEHPRTNLVTSVDSKQDSQFSHVFTANPGRFPSRTTSQLRRLLPAPLRVLVIPSHCRSPRLCRSECLCRSRRSANRCLLRRSRCRCLRPQPARPDRNRSQ
jgi:hypothetical protein